MALLGAGVLAIWNGIADEAEADFVGWHVREHIPERVAVPGFLRGRRYVAIAGRPKYFNFYETETTDALQSRAYLDRLNAPSDWTKRVVRRFQDTSRTVCAVAVSLGLGEGAFIDAARLSTSVARGAFADRMRRLVLEPALTSPGIVAAHLLEGKPDAGAAPTAEKALRGAPDETADWILLIEGVDAEPLAHAAAGPTSPERLAEAGAGFDAGARGVYRLQFSLSRAELG